MAWICDICGAEFDEPLCDDFEEDMNGEVAYYRWNVCVCPNCGSEAIYEEDDDA